MTGKRKAMLRVRWALPCPAMRRRQNAFGGAADARDKEKLSARKIRKDKGTWKTESERRRRLAFGLPVFVMGIGHHTSRKHQHTHIEESQCRYECRAL